MIAALPETQRLMNLRALLLSSVQRTLEQVGLLDRFRVTGVIATWWGDVQNDLKTVAARRFMGLVEAREVSILTAMEGKRTRDKAIRKTEQIIAKLEQVKHGFLHDLLTRGKQGLMDDLLTGRVRVTELLQETAG